MDTRQKFFSENDLNYMRQAVGLARRGCGTTSPNPAVGAVLMKGGKLIGRGWHRRAGGPHAEIEALRDAQKHGHNPRGATLFVTLEPCCTQGCTPPCTDAIVAAGIKRVVVGTMDPNPKHSGRAFKILRRAGIMIDVFGVPRSRGKDNTSHPSRLKAGLQTKLAGECARLNEAFNHWIVHRTPFVTVKAAMTLDGKIATANGESKWITSEKARAEGMKLRRGSDAILVGVNTVLADDPSLTARTQTKAGGAKPARPLRRIVLDSLARTPLTARVVNDEFAAWTTIVVSEQAPARRVSALAGKVVVLTAPPVKTAITNRRPAIPLAWLLERLGAENVTSLLVEGGGEVNASFLLGGLAQRVAFFYAPKILGGRDARKAVAGEGAKSLAGVVQLGDIEWRKLGEDLLLRARVLPR